MAKWKFVAQASSLWLSLLALGVLVLPLGWTAGLPSQIAAGIFVVGAVVDVVILIRRTPANINTAKWVGAMMVFSFLLNIIGASILFFPLLRDPQIAIWVTAGIAAIDCLFETVELIKL